MKTLLRVLVILAAVALFAQTTRHVYVRWLESRRSVLDTYDKPLKDEIESATSLDDLVRRYDPIRKQADRARAEHRGSDSKDAINLDEEPFKSESALREAIQSWERRAAEVRSLRFYWTVGLLFSVVGVVCFTRVNRWLGLTLLIAGFSEMVYWTSPEFFGAATREFDRLLVNKLALSLISIAMLGVSVKALQVFRDNGQ